MTREEILSLAWETAGNPKLWVEDDIVTFAEAVARRAVEEYLEKASAEFDEAVEQMLEVHGRKK